MTLSLLAGNATAVDTLRSAADRRGFLMGNAAWESGSNGHSVQYTDTLKREFNSVSTRGQMCTALIHPYQASYNFGETDKVFTFAQANGMKVWAHCLLSTQDNPATLPSWIKNGNFTRDQLLAIMKSHLSTVIGRYKGRVGTWSVVNEPVKTSAFWNQKVGTDWVEQALRFAYEADPQTKLLINEYGVEGPNAKFTTFYNLVKSMKDRGVPLHAVGLQVTVDLNFNVAGLADVMQRLAAIGLDVHVTELAVRLYTSTPSAAQLDQQAAKYREILKACLAQPRCKLMTIFGIPDHLHWLVVAGNKDAPLIFDSQYRPKPAYFALLNELGGVPPVPTPTPTQTNAATFVSQSVPTSMTAGQSYSVSVTMRNSGTSTWTAAGGYKLGSQNPQDNMTWGLHRVLLAAGDAIAPGQSKTFTFTAKAPTVAKTYNFQWRMVRENVMWFGALSTNVGVVVSGTATPPQQTPYGGTAWAVPGTIQAENFDVGGEGIAYHDADASNAGGAYRTGGVDIYGGHDGGTIIGLTKAGEWLEYTVNVAAAGIYTLEARVSAWDSSGKFHVEFNGVNKTGTITMPVGKVGTLTWTNQTRTVSLSAGTQVMRIALDTNGTGGLEVANLNYIRLIVAIPSASG